MFVLHIEYTNSGLLQVLILLSLFYTLYESTSM